MKENPQQTANRITEEVYKAIDSGVWSCVLTHLHLVPEKNIDKAVFYVSILLLDSLIDELLPLSASKAQHFIDTKKILEDKKIKTWQ
jgi:RNA-binding protein YlmH